MDAHSVSFYDIDVVTIDGKPQKMEAYRSKTLLIVNVASECGFTPQYVGLQALYDKFRDRGLVVLGFPCNQFGHQEPGGEAEIEQFCTRNYSVTFPLFAKIDVNGANARRSRIGVRSCNNTFRGAWRGSGSSGFFGLSRVCGSTSERDKTAPRIR